MQLNRKKRFLLIFSEKLNLYGLLYLISFCLPFSCNDKVKDNPPEIIIREPVSEISANAVDSVYIKADIEDDSGPVTFSAYIANAGYQPLTSMLVRQSPGKSLVVEDLYSFSNIYLETGIYYLVMQAGDGLNVTRKTVKANITGIPRRLKSVYICVKNPSGLSVHCSDSSGNFEYNGFISGNFIDMAINSYTQQLLLLEKSGSLKAFSFDGFTPLWTSGGLARPGYEYNGQLRVSENLVWVTDADGYIKSVDMYGVIRESRSAWYGSPLDFYFSGNRTIVTVFNQSTQARYIQVLSQNGGVIHSYQVLFSPLCYSGYNENSVMVFGQSQNHTVMNTYNYEINYLYPFGNNINSKFFGAMETPDGKYLVATRENMRIIEKLYGMQTDFAQGYKSELMKFENISGLLYSADSLDFRAFIYPSGTLVATASFPSEILFFDFLYNK